MIHPQATVDDTVTIGIGTRVWQFASVVRHAVLGDGCSVASCAIVDGARLGDRCIICHGAFVNPGIRLGNDVFIGPHVSLCNDTWPRVSKDGFELAPMVRGEFVTIMIEDGASIGANVVVLPGVLIGRGAIVASNSVVDRTVPPDCLFKRDGEIVKLDPGRPLNRMREAPCSTW